MRDLSGCITLAAAAGLAMSASTASAQLTNPGFETGDLTGWTITGSSGNPVIDTANVHGGSNAAMLGNNSGSEPLGDSAFYQQFLAPGGGNHLQFWYKRYTTDSIAYDWQDAYIQDSNGTTLATIFHTCSTTDWTLADVDLAPYAGQTIRIALLCHQDGFGDDTALWVDDFAIIVPPTGACCTVDGCVLMTQISCQNAGGTYGGDNAPCSAAFCPTGACCTANGCVIKTSAGCTAVNGTYGGDGSACTQAFCPSGACCLPTGCSVMTSNGCSNAGGTFSGNGVACSAITCNPIAWAEVGEAGETLGTAQVVSYSSGLPLQYITGNITSSDADMYKINICNFSTFLATTAGNTTTNDTQLFLFDSTGHGVVMDDDDIGVTNTLQSRITSQFVTANGDYYLAISFYNNDPLDASNALIWNNQNSVPAFGPEWQPNGPAAANPIATWQHAGTTAGAYRIDLTGVCFVANAPSCYANCDQSTAPPVLNANDFQCFLNKYAANDSYANCDGSTSPPVLNANDFQCFLNKYAAGCT